MTYSMWFDSFSFDEEGEMECERLGTYFSQVFSISPAEVSCGFWGDDYVVEITENGQLVNKYIASPDMDGRIGSLRISGINLGLIQARYNRDNKVLWFNADNCEKDPWGEWLEFSIIH